LPRKKGPAMFAKGGPNDRMHAQLRQVFGELAIELAERAAESGKPASLPESR